MSTPEDQAKLWSLPHLNHLTLFRAHIVKYSFKRHAHDYFVIGMVEAGLQQFSYGAGRGQYITPPAGLIVINPGEAHTGEAAGAKGFAYRALYPDAATMQHIAAEMGDQHTALPVFAEPVLQDAALFRQFSQLHHTLESTTTTLEHESRLMWALAQLIARHAVTQPNLQPVKPERQEIQRLRQYLEDHCAEDVTLAELAQLVHWNPFYLLRVFRNSVGFAPHAYLENTRIRRAQALIRQRLPLVEVAYATGFSSQSHFTNSFKRFIGVTPGQYAKQVNFLQDTPPPPDIP
jgi:AraC-like DNA-binding protein